MSARHWAHGEEGEEGRGCDEVQVNEALGGDGKQVVGYNRVAATFETNGRATLARRRQASRHGHGALTSSSSSKLQHLAMEPLENAARPEPEQGQGHGANGGGGGGRRAILFFFSPY